MFYPEDGVKNLYETSINIRIGKQLFGVFLIQWGEFCDPTLNQNDAIKYLSMCFDWQPEPQLYCSGQQIEYTIYT